MKHAALRFLVTAGTDTEATLSAEYGGTGGSNAAVDAVYVALGRVLTISGRTIKDEAQVRATGFGQAVGFFSLEFWGSGHQHLGGGHQQGWGHVRMGSNRQLAGKHNVCLCGCCSNHATTTLVADPPTHT